MVNFDFYWREVLPHVDATTRQVFAERYPQVVLNDGYPVTDYPVLMLVGLTGAGKTTTLQALAEQRLAGGIAYSDGLPSRRDLADMLVIPTGQVLLGEAVAPVRDRVQRFRYTRAFAGHVPGGLAAAFTWLHLTETPDDMLVSEGIRGPGEIAYTLAHCMRWHVLELVADPLTRLTRLSDRNDRFDWAAGITNVDFLPPDAQGPALTALQSGSVSPAALAIVRAEAENYGFASGQAAHARYTCVPTDTVGPDAVVEQAVTILRKIGHDA